MFLAFRNMAPPANERMPNGYERSPGNQHSKGGQRACP